MFGERRPRTLGNSGVRTIRRRTGEIVTGERDGGFNRNTEIGVGALRVQVPIVIRGKLKEHSTCDLIKIQFSLINIFVIRTSLGRSQKTKTDDGSRYV